MATQRPIPPALLGVAYVGLTVIGLYLFRGVPVLNIALGFPIGAWIVTRREAHAAGDPPQPGWVRPRTLRSLLGWSVSLAAVTIAATWLELLVSVLAVRFNGSLGGIAGWLPLSAYESRNALRALMFAIASAPALQILTTVFGGFIVLAFSRDHG